jgi:hypothetical protein
MFSPAPHRLEAKTGSRNQDRIMIYRKHSLVPINHVNPIYINDLEQIHMVSRIAILAHAKWLAIGDSD